MSSLPGAFQSCLLGATGVLSAHESDWVWTSCLLTWVLVFMAGSQWTISGNGIHSQILIYVLHPLQLHGSHRSEHRDQVAFLRAHLFRIAAACPPHLWNQKWTDSGPKDSLVWVKHYPADYAEVSGQGEKLENSLKNFSFYIVNWNS